jgi:protein disulfide-isomerase A6
LEPEYEKAAKILKGAVKVVAVDSTAHESLGQKYGVQGFPTLKIFGADKKKPMDYEGARTSDGIVTETMKKLNGLVKERKNPGNKGSTGGDKPAKKGVVTLTESNFKEQVLQSDELWMVEFYAPWCGHCKNLTPHWKKAAKDLDGEVKLGMVDATVHGSLGQKYEVKGYPTIKVFKNGKAEDYNGPREQAGIVDYARNIKKSFKPKTGAKKEKKQEEPKKSAVIELTESNFKSEVLDSSETWMVEFFAPWCGHCKSLAPEWDKAAKKLVGKVKLGAVDATAHASLGQTYKIEGYPTIKVFKTGSKSNPSDYNGGRDSNGIVSFAENLVGAKKDKSGQPKTDVAELTESNFEELVMNSADHWYVEFFAPWCGHCKNLAPEWETAAGQLKGQVKLGAIDATAHASLGQRYEVKGYPTIKIFPAGVKSDDKVEDYQGARESEVIVEHAMSTLDKHGIPPPITEITSNEIFDDNCGASKRICVIMFVPHILDSGAEGRNKLLSTYLDLAKKMRSNPYNFIWTEGGSQISLENSIDINSVYPSLAVVSTSRKVYAVQKLSWNPKNLASFLSGVINKNEKTMKLSSTVTIEETAAWDGLDGSLPEEEMSLEDIMG